MTAAELRKHLESVHDDSEVRIQSSPPGQELRMRKVEHVWSYCYTNTSHNPNDPGTLYVMVLQ